MKNKKIIDKSIIISIFFFIIILIILKDIFYNEITYYDNWALKVFNNDFRNNEMTLIMTIITNLGSFLFITAILLVLLIIYKNKKTIYYIIINTITIYLMNDFIKFLVHRPRPSNSLIKEYNYSFPSSHSMVSTILYGFLIYLVYKIIKNKIIKYILITILSLLILLICISRLYFGVHYLSDVVAGFSISMIYIMIFTYFNKDFEKKV